MSKLVSERCPNCQGPLWLDLVLKATPIGEFSLAGTFVKIPVRQLPTLECEEVGCGWKTFGEVSDGEAVFRRTW